MWHILLARISSRRLDLAILEYVSGAGAIAVLVCGVLFVERLWLDGVGLLVGYGLVLLVVLSLVAIALLAELLRRLPGSPPPAGCDAPARRREDPPGFGQPESQRQAAS